MEVITENELAALTTTEPRLVSIIVPPMGHRAAGRYMAYVRDAVRQEALAVGGQALQALYSRVLGELDGPHLQGGGFSLYLGLTDDGRTVYRAMASEGRDSLLVVDRRFHLVR